MDSTFLPLIHKFGAVDTQFLARNVEVLDPPPPITLSDRVSVRDAIECLKKHKIGCVVLVDEEEKISGVFSERDVLTRVVMEQVVPEETPICDIMTANPSSEQMTTSVAFLLQLMSDGGFRHVPIVDEENYPIGIVSVKDILDFIKTEIVTQLVATEFNK